MAGGGCTLPGCATVLMPGEGYEGVTKFVMDRMTSYGLNACPPLLVGVGVATSVETAALLSKKALMRPIGSHNENERAAKMEKLLEDGINAIGLGPQGMGGMKEQTAAACKDFGCIHVVIPAGNAVVAAVAVEEIEREEWRDLGMPETLWNCRVKEFGPLIVSIDAQGRNYFEEKKVEYNKRKDEQIEKICKEVKFIK